MSERDNSVSSEMNSGKLLEMVKTEARKVIEGMTNVSPATRSRIRKWINDLNMESNAWKSLTVVIATYASTPLGSALITTIVIMLLEKAGFFKGWLGTLSADTILTVVWSSEVLGAIGGGQGLSALLGGLGGLLGAASG
ncbi:MAG: hypothetical protein QW478_07165 [Candidatus Micrarchaeaceae archaeon]